MENIVYHPSLYTITVADNDSLIIYNSLNGKKNNIVNPLLIDKIKTMLNQTIIYDDGTTAFRYLVENRFIVPLHTDERKLAEVVRLDRVMNHNLRLVIMPTEQCNFRCQYCYESFKHGKMSLEHQNGIIEYIRRNINRFTSVHLEWYGGEPLLAFDIIQYISNAVLDICRCAKKPMTSSITTNGYYLTLDVFKELQRYHVINIQITIDGLKSTHDKQRVLANGDPTYDVILHNLLEIKNKTKSATSRIVLRTNVTKDIFETFDEYIDYYDSLFGEDIRFSYLIRPVGDWGGEAVHNIEEKIMSRDSFADIYQKIIQKNKLNLQFYEDYFEPAGSICYAAIRNCYIIRANGHINKCTCTLDSEENDIGMVTESGEFQIDDNKLANWICINKQEACDECQFYGSCMHSNCPMKSMGPKECFTCSYERVYLVPTLIMLSRAGIIKKLEEVVE